MSQSLFFTSDMHLFHARVLEYDQSPFSSIEEQHQAIIERWNNVVSDDDTVYILGDCIFPSRKDSKSPEIKKEAIRIMNTLKGNLHLIKGNHEDFCLDNPEIRDRFSSIENYKEIYVNKQMICLFHYPIHEWRGASRGSWMLHGHTHTKDTYDKSYKITNVGIMNWDYTPVSFEQLKIVMADRINLTTH